MSVNLLALCGSPSSYEVKRIQIDAQIQGIIEGIFIAQEAEFFDGISEEIPFDGGWRPEKDQLLVIDWSEECKKIFAEAKQTLVAIKQLDAKNFANERIKALLVYVERPSGGRLLIQNFSNRQLLEKKFSLILDGNTFTQLTRPAFSLGTYLAGVVENEKIKFSSFNNIKMIFDLMYLYKEATDLELKSFSQHTKLQLRDAESFAENADQVARKLVHAILKRGILDDYSALSIKNAAAEDGVDIQIIADRIIVPTDKKDMKELLHYLDDGIYRSGLSGIRYLSNSKRPI